MSDKPVFSAAATIDPAASIASTNKVLSNTYWLLGLTLAFSALTATLAVVMNMPQAMALPLIIVGFVLLFVVHKMADSAKGLPAIFAFTGVWGASIGPMLSMYLALENGPTIVLQALGGTALVFFSLSAYALNTKKGLLVLGRLLNGRFGRCHRGNDCQHFPGDSRSVVNALCSGRYDHGGPDFVRYQPHHPWRRN
jgi:modulator of FtsH protease